jgi:hypothetical protein
LKTFHHGGRLGDCLFALYTIKELGGGRLALSLYQQGGWYKYMIDALLPLIEYQSYIEDCGQCDQEDRHQYDVDFVKYENMFNPLMFPEWEGPDWPGNIHIGKRYAACAGVTWSPGRAWLQAPQTYVDDLDIVFHAPMRRCMRDPDRWADIIRNLCIDEYNIAVIGSKEDIEDWEPRLHSKSDFTYYGKKRDFSKTGSMTLVIPDNFLQAADYINSAKLFMGAISSCHAIAEGLGVWTMCDVHTDCSEFYSKGKTGVTCNSWQTDQVLKVAGAFLNNYPHK